MDEWVRKLIGPKLDQLSKEVITKHGQIRMMINSARQRTVEANQKHAKVLAEINDEIVGYQKRCDHPVVTHRPDPAGGSDSDTVCDVCGWSDAGYHRRS